MRSTVTRWRPGGNAVAVMLALMRVMMPLLLLCLMACEKSPVAATASASLADEEVHVVSQWVLPAMDTAAQPDLIASADGTLLLSWISAESDGHVLRISSFDGMRWSAPREIARGKDWFVNWADTPHLAATGDGALWAQWLRKSASATYAYDVVLSRSADGGISWAPPVSINDDGTPTEHGFVSMWPQSREAIGIAWLDGRNTAGQGHGGHDGHGAGAMTLRVASVDARLQRSNESEIDTRTCDCCQTDTAVTARGPLLVYRDRDDNEIRDIAATRLQDGTWTPPHPVHRDQWLMPACPVNGPAVSARGNHAWVAWYTAAGELPKLQLAHSENAGDTFATPVEVDQGDAMQGRAGVAADGERVWVSWIREDANGQSLWLARYTEDLSREIERIEVAKLQGRGRATGFPQLVVNDAAAHLVWTDVVDGKPVLRGARIDRQASRAGRL